jgi:F420-non-reducing hydrogenase small subunit
MKLATLCLTSCSGCHIGLLAMGDDFLPILENLELTFSPILMDVKKPPKVDVALIEGAIRNQEDKELIKDVRSASKLLIAMGSCACYGGVTGIGSCCSSEELLNEAYKQKKGPELTPLTPRVSPVDSVVEVDYYIVGCPPPVPVLKETLGALLKGKELPHFQAPVCATCERVVKGEFSKDTVRLFEQFPHEEECLLTQGYICLGSVTRGGCEANCTSMGFPCQGCRGPTDRIFTEASHGIYQDLVKRRTHYLGIPIKEAEKHIFDLMHTLYSFTLSSPFMRRKRSERVSNLIHRIVVSPQ